MTMMVMTMMMMTRMIIAMLVMTMMIMMLEMPYNSNDDDFESKNDGYSSKINQLFLSLLLLLRFYMTHFYKIMRKNWEK